MSVKDKIYHIISHQLGVLPETLNNDLMILSDLNADPLDLVDLIAALEEEFDIEIKSEEVKGLESIGNVVNLVSEKVNEI